MRRLRRRSESQQDIPLATPPLRQVQETECGVIALAIVLTHFGAWVPLPELRRRCQVSDEGVTALSLVETGKHYGLAIRAMRMGKEGLRYMPAPAILFWENNHFVVLEGIQDHIAWVNDPARGHRRLQLDELDAAYSGVVLMTRPGPAFRPFGRPRKPFQDVVEMLQPARRWLGLMSLAVLAESVLLPAIILALGNAIGDYPETALDRWPLFALMLVGFVSINAVRYWLTGRAISSVDRNHSVDLDKILGSAWATFVQGWQFGRLSNRTSTGRNAAGSAARVITIGIRFLASIPLLVLAIGRIHPYAAALTFVSLTTLFAMERLAGQSSGNLGRFGHWWPFSRVVIGVIPVVGVGALVAGQSHWLSTVSVAALASWVAYRLVRDAAQTTGTLHALPGLLGELPERPFTRSAVTKTA